MKNYIMREMIIKYKNVIKFFVYVYIKKFNGYK